MALIRIARAFNVDVSKVIERMVTIHSEHADPHVHQTAIVTPATVKHF